LLSQDKAASLPLPLQGLKFIGLSKLYRDHEAQMFRLLSKKIAAAEAKVTAAQPG
jgi:NADH:ubiquinone oxidoreductase subunit K